MRIVKELMEIWPNEVCDRLGFRVHLGLLVGITDASGKLSVLQS